MSRFGDFVNRKLEAASQCPECGCGYTNWRTGCSCTHDSCECAEPGSWGAAPNDPAHDDTECMSSMGYAGAPVGQVWGTVNPDGSVTARGFTDNEDYADDTAVHPVMSLVAYNAEDNTWVHMATGQTVARQLEIDAERAERDRAKTASSSAPGAGATTTGGTAMSAVSEAKGLLAQASEKTEFAAGANQQIISSLEEAQQSVLAAVEESSQAASDEAQALIAQALEAANEMTQLIAAIPQTLESIQL